MDDSNINIYVEMEDGPRFADVGFEFGEKHTEEAKQAIKNSLGVIQWMAEKTKEALDKVHDKPSTAEIEFGIKINSKAGVIVAQAEAEFHIKAKLVWQKAQPDASSK